MAKRDKKVALDYDEWNKDVAPSNELRKWFHQHPDQFDKFVEDYHQELSHHSAAWMPLVESEARQSHLAV